MMEVASEMRELPNVNEEVGGELAPDDRGGPNIGRASRKRNNAFLTAKEVISSPSLSYHSAWGSAGTVISLAQSYHHFISDRGVVLVHKKTKKILTLPYYTRFSDGYYRKAIRKIRGIRSQEGVFLTLTLDPRRCLSLADAYEKLQKGWNMLLSMLRKRNKGNLKFVKTVEFQKSGSPHLHILFFGISRLLDADELRKFWDEKYGAGTFVYLKKLQRNPVGKVSNYICKYMSKYLTCPDREHKGSDGLIDAPPFIQLCLSWALNLRAFSTSRGIFNNSPRTTQTNEWLFLGSFELSEVWSWNGEHFDSKKEALLMETRPPDAWPGLWEKISCLLPQG